MRKRTIFIRLTKPEEAKKALREEGLPIPEDIDKIGGRTFKVFEENDDTITIYAYGKYRDINRALINEVIYYDRDEVLSALRTLKEACDCYISCDICGYKCPFYSYQSDACLFEVLPEDEEIVDVENWRPVR